LLNVLNFSVGGGARPDWQQRLQAAAKSALTHWMENSRSSRVLKIDITSVIDVNKNKRVDVGK